MRLALGRPFWIVAGATAAWALVFIGSHWAPKILGRPGQSGWDALGHFLMVQMVALGLAAVSLIVLIFCWRRIGWIGRAVGSVPTLVTLAVAVFLAFGE